MHKDKESLSDVDEREKSRYGSKINIEEVSYQYESMMNLCRKAISQAEEIVFSDKELTALKELYK